MQVDKMTTKKLGTQQGNDDGDSNQHNSSNGLPLSSSREKKLKADIEISPIPQNALDIIYQKVNFDDVFDFAVVCKEWKKVQEIFLKSETSAPLIVQTTSYAKKYLSFYSIPEQQAYSAKMNYFWGLNYSGSSSGYVIMAGADSKLHLMNPFTRREKIINTSPIDSGILYYACRALLAFPKVSKDPKEFVLVALNKASLSLHVYQSRHSSWATYSIRGRNQWNVVDIVVFHNLIYVLTDQAKIGILSLNSTSLKILELQNTPNVESAVLKILKCDEKLLVVDFELKVVLNVYEINFSTMSYVKLETLGDMALFYSMHKCYALSNPGKVGYDRNCVYYTNWADAECKVYSGSNNERLKCFVPTGQPPPRSKFYWLDWFFRKREVVDYSL